MPPASGAGRVRAALSPREAFARYAARFDPVTDPRVRRLLVAELVVVLAVTFGLSGAYAVLDLVSALLAPADLGEQTAALNVSRSEHPWLDLAYQVAYMTMPLMPVLLAFYLLAVHRRPEEGPFRVMGFDLRRPGFDLAWGFGIFAGIGAAGLAFYLTAVAIGINTQVSPANLAENWWTVPVLILLAIKNGILEEVLMIGFLFTRWSQTGGRMWVIVVISSLIRGAYHLYQGFGGFIGNVVMGLAFGWLFLTVLKRRVMPLVVTHSLLDIVSFLGAGLLPTLMSWIGR